MIIYLSLLISMIGLVVYAISTDGKAQTIGIHCFWVGLLAFLLQLNPHTVSLLGR